MTPNIQKKKVRKVKFNIMEPVFNNAISCYLGYSWQEVLKEVEKHQSDLLPELKKCTDMDITPGLYLEASKPNGDRFKILFARDIDLPLIAHELVHACIRSHRYRGLELNEGSEEAYAYYYEFMWREILSNLSVTVNTK